MFPKRKAITPEHFFGPRSVMRSVLMQFPLESNFILDDPNVVGTLVSVAVFLFIALILTFRFSHPGECRYLPPVERLVAVAAGAMLLASFGVRVLSMIARARVRTTTSFSGTGVAVLTVNAISCATNFLLAFDCTLVMEDLVIGRKFYMTRWASWVVLAGVLMFIVEALAVSSGSSDRPSAVAIVQSMCTLAGLLLPFAHRAMTWALLILFGVCGYGIVYQRLFVLTRERDTLTIVLETSGHTELWSARSFDLKRLEIAVGLLKVCAFTWTLILIEWFVSSGMYVVLRQHPSAASSTDWCFVAECCLDLAAKLMYASYLHEVADQAPAEFAQERANSLRCRMGSVWSACGDVIILTARETQAYSTASTQRAYSLVSRSLESLIGSDDARKWIGGFSHPLELIPRESLRPQAEESSGLLSRGFEADVVAFDQDGTRIVRCDDMVHLISLAVHEIQHGERRAPGSAHSSKLFTCELVSKAAPASPPGSALAIWPREGTKLCEVHYSTNELDWIDMEAKTIAERGRVVSSNANDVIFVLRDVTERIRNRELERLLSQRLSSAQPAHA